MIDENSAAQAREDLIGFLSELIRLLERIIKEPYGQNGELLILPEMQGELNEAWEAFIEDFDFEVMRIRIMETPAARLQSSGLYGAQLRAKRTLFGTRVRRWLDSRKQGALLWLIDSADVILGSMIAATGVDEAIKEIKELVRGSVDEE